MKVSREKKEAHRREILEAASRLFRERGPEGVSVAEIMQAAGLTHGGFYGHFASKEDLLAATVGQTLAATASEVEGFHGRFDEYIRAYLSDLHLQGRGTGCPIAALGSDMARQDVEVRRSFTAGLRAFLTAVEGATGDGRADAVATAAQLVGAMVMARAAAGVDDELAAELLEATRQVLETR